MKKRAILASLLCLFIIQAGMAQNEPQYTLSGYIKDGSSGEELLYANVLEPTTSAGATTNLYGFYSLTLPAGQYELTFTYLGFQSLTRTIILSADTELNVELTPSSAMLQEVVVTDKAANESVKQVAMSRIALPIEDIKKMPSLMGEPDVIKTIQTLPGVTSAGEGTSAFFVRGGSADQNLVLLDEAPVYDVSHLFGLFSVFNADIIKNAELYKGGIPSKYGGRLSSLLEVTTRDGNAKQFSGSGGIGILAAKGTIEGPIVKDKASFILAGRRSYADLYTRNSEQLDGTAVIFHDLNAKVNWKASNKDRFFLSAYSGRDIWQFDDAFQMDWGNTTTSFRWNHRRPKTSTCSSFTATIPYSLMTAAGFSRMTTRYWGAIFRPFRPRSTTLHQTKPGWRCTLLPVRRTGTISTLAPISTTMAACLAGSRPMCGPISKVEP